MLSGKQFLIVVIVCKLLKEDRHTLEILQDLIDISIKLNLLSKIKPRI